MEVDGGQLCDKAFAKALGDPGGALPHDALLPGALLCLYRDTDINGRPSWSHPKVPGFPFDRPMDRAKVKAVTCIVPRSVAVGTYILATGGVGGTAWRQDWEVRVLEWPIGDVRAATLLEGGRPPAERGVALVNGAPVFGDATGSNPLEALEAWLKAKAN
jgi:hypothetical protein